MELWETTKIQTKQQKIRLAAALMTLLLPGGLFFAARHQMPSKFLGSQNLKSPVLPTYNASAGSTQDHLQQKLVAQFDFSQKQFIQGSESLLHLHVQIKQKDLKKNERASTGSLHFQWPKEIKVVSSGPYKIRRTPYEVIVDFGEVLPNKSTVIPLTLSIPTTHLGLHYLGPIKLNYRLKQQRWTQTYPSHHLQYIVVHNSLKDQALASINRNMVPRFKPNTVSSKEGWDHD